MERKSFLQIVEYIEEFANAHDQIRKVGFDFYEQIDNVLTKSEKYPAFFIVPLPSTFEANEEGANLNTFNLDVYCLDIIQKDRNNIKEIISDTALMLNDLLLFFKEGEDWSFEAEKVGNVDPINNSLLDYAAGNKMTLAVTVSGYSVCEIPMGEIVPFVPVCEPAAYKVEDQNGAELEAGEIAAGAYKLITINVGDCEPATAVLKTVGGTVLDSVVIPSGESGDVVAPNSNYSIKDTGGLELYSGQTESGGTLNKTIQDATIKNTDNSVSIDLKAEEVKTAPDITVFLVNSLGTLLSETIVPSLKDIEAEAPNINFTDSNGAVSSVPAGVDIVATPAGTPTSASAKVMQTGQTSTYSSDEIGYVTKGRLVNFFTVNFITPFGNSNRFTSTNHAAQTTYTNEIVLDWSTFDEPTQTVLGYDRRLVHSGATYDFTHSAGITLAKNHSRGTYTSGWRMWNRNEFNNIVNLEYSNGFAPPFDNASGGQIETQNMWLINTLKISTSQAWFTAYYGNIDYGAKSGNRRVIAVRDFTVSGTTIL